MNVANCKSRTDVSDHKGIREFFTNTGNMSSMDKLIIGVALVGLAGCATTPGVHSRGDMSEVNSGQTFAVIPVAVDASVSTTTAPTVEGASSLLPLTIPEVRQLLASVLWPLPRSAPLLLAWSWWRRCHQSRASYFHTQRRTASKSAPSLFALSHSREK